MTTDPRYTDAAHALAVAMHDANCHDRTCNATTIASTYGGLAITALDHLAATGRLLPDGGETYEEFGIQSSAGTLSAWLSRTEAETHIRVREQAGRPPGTLVSRTVYTEPWQPAQPAGDDG